MKVSFKEKVTQEVTIDVELEFPIYRCTDCGEYLKIWHEQGWFWSQAISISTTSKMSIEDSGSNSLDKWRDQILFKNQWYACDEAGWKFVVKTLQDKLTTFKQQGWYDNSK